MSEIENADLKSVIWVPSETSLNLIRESENSFTLKFAQMEMDMYIKRKKLFILKG